MGKTPKAGVPDGSALLHIPPWLAGASGGAFSSSVQFFGSTLDDFLTAVFSWDFLAVKLFSGFLIGLAGFSFCGGLLAYFLQARTQSRWALFLTAALATSAGGSSLPGLVKLLKRVDLAPISSAYAAQLNSCDDVNKITVYDGLKKFLGVDESSYRVVAGSFKKPEDAWTLVNKLKTEDPSLSAFVGDHAACNEYYPVIVGPPATTLYEAKKIQEKVQKFDWASDAYISNRSR